MGKNIVKKGSNNRRDIWRINVSISSLYFVLCRGIFHSHPYTGDFSQDYICNLSSSDDNRCTKSHCGFFSYGHCMGVDGRYVGVYLQNF